LAGWSKTVFSGDETMYVPDDASSIDPEVRRENSLKEIVTIVMNSPIGDGAPVKLDGRMSMMSLKDKNLDVQTGIAVRMANQALGGDVKSANWLVRMRGMEPVKEQKIMVDLPVFYSNPDELPEDVKQALAAEMATVIEDAKEDDASVEVEYEVLDSKEED
jgi:hypothetical protein